MTYERETLGHILQALRDWGIPERIAGSVTVGMFSDDQNKRDRVFYGNQLFAEYKYFDGIEQPLFFWHQDGESYGAQQFERQDDNTLIPKFRLSLGYNKLPVLLFKGFDATRELKEFILDIIWNESNAETYKLCCACRPLYRSNSVIADDFLVLFQAPEGAQAFVDYINKNYRPT